MDQSPNILMGKGDMSVCCCKMHIEFDLAWHTLNELRSCHVRILLHGDRCPCLQDECSVCRPPRSSSCCKGLEQVGNPRSMWNSMFYPKPTNYECHNIECVLGRCKDCGVKKQFNITSIVVRWITVYLYKFHSTLTKWL